MPLNKLRRTWDSYILIRRRPFTQKQLCIAYAERGANASYDKDMIKRLEEVENLPPQEKDRIFHFIDLIIRDFKTSRAYAS